MNAQWAIASIIEGITVSAPCPCIISALYGLTTWLVNTPNLGQDKSAQNCNGKEIKSNSLGLIDAIASNTVEIPMKTNGFDVMDAGCLAS